jgi:superfamily II DNA/RNA helicase
LPHKEFRDDIEHILKAVPATRQLRFYSATIPRAIQDLIGRYSQDPAWIKIESVAQNAPQVGWRSVSSESVKRREPSPRGHLRPAPGRP